MTPRFEINIEIDRCSDAAWAEFLVQLERQLTTELAEPIWAGTILGDQG
tara:strand:- start:657 stop:803 length:147 start_codon:yes stop_codon:yes gene_type:complete